MTNSLVGRTITGVRTMTEEEMDTMDWYGHVLIYTLDDGTEMVASKDDEGNGAGSLWHVDAGEFE